MHITKKINICGIGPGDPDLIVKAVFRKVEEADMLIGGQRHLDIFASYNKECHVFDGKLSPLKDFIEECPAQNIVVLVSGDTGFHSLRRYLKSAFNKFEIELTPGISSFQYFYAKLGLGYEKAFKTSLHGSTTEFLDKITDYESVFLLTDKINNWKTIAQQLCDIGHPDITYHIGNNLSYPDEKIISTTAGDALKMDYDFHLCAVIIEKNKKEQEERNREQEN